MELETLVTKLSILTKDVRVERFQLNWAQQEYLRVAQHQLETTGKIRIIVLKARQLGISTVTEALLFTLCFLYDNYKAMVIAHEVPASQNLLAMTQRYWDTYPFKQLYTTKYAGKNHLQWTETGSSIHVATAGNKGVGRSATIHAVHASEVAFWPDPEIAMLGLRQTIPQTPGTAIVLESTANGMGNYFHKMWLDAEAGESEFIPLFFPWHKHPEYTASYIGLPFDEIGELDDEERQLRQMGVSDDRLVWRRYAIRDLCQGDLLKFKQEYPATPAEAFIASGTNVFPHAELGKVYDPQPGIRGVLWEDTSGVTFKPASDGPLTVFKAPAPDSDHGQYFVAGDPTHTTRGDFAVAQVINRRTLEQVAEWRGRIDPVSFADVLFLLGHYYNTAEVVTEIEGPGYSTIGALLAKNYPRVYQKARPDTTPGKVSTEQYGWSTTMQSKHLMVGWLLRTVVEGSLTIHSSTLYNEMRNYVTLDNGGYGPAGGQGQVKGYDDTVMSMAMAVTCHFMSSPLMPYGELIEPVEGSLMSVAPWQEWSEN
jgi:hypothetical protein